MKNKYTPRPLAGRELIFAAGKIVDYMPANYGDAIEGLQLICLADVKAEPVRWLWPGCIPAGKITLLCGAPGGGKSFVTVDWAARITTGRDWPDGKPCVAGSVIMANAEDGPADTIRPRFDACGGNVDRVKLIECVRRDGDGRLKKATFTLADVAHIAAALRTMPDCRMIVIDPIGSFLGRGVDAHRDNEVRSVLTPLAELAAATGVAVVIVAHVRKGGGGRADERALGSVGFVGIARTVHHLIRDADNPRRRLFLPGKNNLADEGHGLAFTIDGDPPSVQWEREPLKLTADDAYAAADGIGRHAGDARKPGPAPAKRSAAERFIIDVLAGGQRSVKDIEREANAAGLSMRTVRRAAEHLGVQREKSGINGGWLWEMKRDGQNLPTASAEADGNDVAAFIGATPDAA